MCVCERESRWPVVLVHAATLLPMLEAFRLGRISELTARHGAAAGDSRFRPGRGTFQVRLWWRCCRRREGCVGLSTRQQAWPGLALSGGD